jgi:D-alanyl-D-alanine dipeptidase
MIACAPLTLEPRQSLMPENFIDIGSYLPNAVIDARYASSNNFTGKPVDGYLANKCLLTRDTAIALRKVQKILLKSKMTLKIYDCYRPQRAVDEFIAWTEDLSDQNTKAEYYPRISKDKLLGSYIASQSGHSRGNTIDLSIMSLDQGNSNDIDMGSNYDLFDSISHTKTDLISSQQQKNRLLLKDAMEKFNFLNYELEWWHFSFQSSDTAIYFNFPIE